MALRDRKRMRIRNYLLILTLSCLAGGYVLEQVLSHQFKTMDVRGERYSRELLWAKDLHRARENVSQYLVSVDLILGSGNTYILYGTLKRGQALQEELSELFKPQNAPSPLSETLSTRSIDVLAKINQLLQDSSVLSPKHYQTQLPALLDTYDQHSTLLAQAMEAILEDAELALQRDQQQLSLYESQAALIGNISRFIFLLLIVSVGVWTNRKICEPLNHLKEESAKAMAGNVFEPEKSAPYEIVELSQHFKQLTDTLYFQAAHDPLTNLSNRRSFEWHLQEHLNNGKQNAALCFIDLDYFKTINDTCGHAVGDDILIHVGQTLHDNLRPSDVVARLGGDEFALLLADCTMEKALDINLKLGRDIREISYQCEDEKFHLSASIGIVEIGHKERTQQNISQILHAADIACSAAKKSGRNEVRVFDPNHPNNTKKQSDNISVHQINAALSKDLFVLYKQAIVPLQSNEKANRFEVLLRMKDERGGVISPDRFLSVASRYRLAAKIDRWVVKACINWLSIRPAELAKVDSVCINLSSQSLGDLETEHFIVEKLANSVVPPHKICFEVTESAAITNLDKARSFIDRLRRLGCRFALDDFGSGHSSYAYLKELPTDIIKIDGSFVRGMLDNPLDYTTVKSIIEVAKTAKQQVVAEYVETKEIAEALRKLGVDFAQGYHYSAPQPLDRRRLRVVGTSLKARLPTNDVMTPPGTR